MAYMTPPRPLDLSAMRQRGGKMMVFHGVADAVFSSNDTASWYEQLNGNLGGRAADFVRYFPVPGMNHCSGGPTTDQFDMLTPLVNWVERGVAPDQVIAQARGPGANVVNAELPAGWSAQRTRPLCPYPQVARYKGTGSLESAASFACR
jgi:Tannase and feruloyl esterase